MTAEPALLDRLEGFYDAVPRAGARVEDHGPLTLFVRDGLGWPFYARPALGHPGPISADDVARVRARQRELRVPEAFEWVHETSPTLRAAAEDAGLEVHAHPLMVLDPDAPAPAVPAPADGVSVRILAAADPALPTALTVPHLAFADPGTRIGTAGTTALTALVPLHADRAAIERAAGRILAGLTVFAAAVDGTTSLCAGQYNPVGEVCEIVGIGTLPSARRRGHALAVTAALVQDAVTNGMRTVFLSAGDDDVARLYARLGFRRVGTALIAEPGPAH
jgi:N-acetylglutamate synthase-like GNAT family acetyltransferase